MRVIVLGAGRMGQAAAFDLARQPGVDLVRLVDKSAEALAAAHAGIERLIRARTNGGAQIEISQLDLDIATRYGDMLRGFDVGLSAIDYRYNFELTRAAIDAGVHMCDLGGNLGVVERQLQLHEIAARRDVTVIPDCGLAPGMAGLLAALGVARFGSADWVKIRVGGLPAHPKPPLNYKLVFSVRGLTNEYIEPSEVLRDGQVVRVPSLSEPEPVEFPYPFGTLEAFHTSGGASTLTRTLRDRVRNLDYKTIRYPGHRTVFAGMHALGLFSKQPLDGVVPLVFTERILERALSDDDTDVVLARVEVSGRLDGRAQRLVFEIIDHHDPKTGHSAMARTTAYPAAAVAYMLGAGAITRRGVCPAELAVPFEEFVGAVRARGIEVDERWLPA
jgi:lysine 6-dehydrogenase